MDSLSAVAQDIKEMEETCFLCTIRVDRYVSQQAFELPKYPASCKLHSCKYLGEMSGVLLAVTMHITLKYRQMILGECK